MDASTSPGRRRDATQGRGTNQSGMRDHNERLVLSLLRQHGSLAKSDIARLTGLSAQTVSVIMRELEEEHLLARGAPKRGRVGQPSIPMHLNPDGAYFLGLKIGRRSCELALIDFTGKLRRMTQRAHQYPTPEETISWVVGEIAAMKKGDLSIAWDRIGGLGIAMPFQLWNWADTAGAPQGAMDGWRERDIAAELSALCPFPVYLQNDGTCACGAELVFGDTGITGDFIYFYVGAFIGGGIAVGGRVYAGHSGNAGALGSMPVPAPDHSYRQLIDVASIHVLESKLREAGYDAQFLWTSPEDWGDIDEHFESWRTEAAEGLAHAIVAASSVVDFEAAIIEGWLPTSLRARLVKAVQSALDEKDSEGLVLPTVREGSVGRHARALGGASLPLAERFLIGAPFNIHS